jgi:hypothetical protein
MDLQVYDDRFNNSNRPKSLRGHIFLLHLLI